MNYSFVSWFLFVYLRHPHHRRQRGAVSVMRASRNRIGTPNSFAATPLRRATAKCWKCRTQDVFPAMNQLAESGCQLDLILTLRLTAKKNVNRAPLHMRSNFSTIPTCRNCSCPAEDLFPATRNATRWNSSRRGRK